MNKNKIKKVIDTILQVFVLVLLSVYTVCSCIICYNNYGVDHNSRNTRRNARINYDIPYINLLTDDVMNSSQYGYINALGSFVEADFLLLTNPIDVMGGMSYVYANDQGSVCYWSEYDSNDNFIASDVHYGVYTLNVNTSYVRLSIIRDNTSLRYYIGNQILPYYSPLDSYFNEEYQAGYSDGLSENTQDSYNKGFSAGVNAVGNPYYMFLDSYFSLGYYQDNNNVYYEYDYDYISISANSFDLTSYYAVLYQEWESDSSHDERGLIFAYIEDYGSFVSSNYELNITGFTQIEFIMGSNDSYVYNISNPYNITNIKLADLNLYNPIIGINLYTYFTEIYFDSNGYKITFDYINNYDNGYKAGYNQGFSNGKNDVLNNHNNYDLYNSEQLNEAKDLSYAQGYNKGVLVDDSLSERGFLTMFNAILNAPYNILNGLLNFEIFGVNLFHLVSFILTTGLIIFLFALFKTRK